MKYLKKYNESASSDFDIEFAITKIKDKYTEEQVIDMFDNEILEWTDEDWADDYESEYDWYVDHNNGEAQDVIIDQIVDWYDREFGNNELPFENKSEIIDRIKGEYDVLN